MFHVPESKRIKTGPRATDSTYGNNGIFHGRFGVREVFMVASDGEQWKDIESWEKLYAVSTLGRVKAYERTVPLPNNAVRVQEQHFVAQEITEKGYPRVSLCRDAAIEKILVHVLVAKTFIENPNNFPQVNHKDGNTGNAHVENLEWCTQEYNAHHAIENGLMIGWTIQEIENIQTMLALGNTPTQIAKKLDCSRQSISGVKAGRYRNLNPEQPAGWAGWPHWEHVSVSIGGRQATRCPTWEEMCIIKKWFWDEEDCVVQFHPPASEYVNNHPYVLHLWRPTDTNIATPPKEFV